MKIIWIVLLMIMTLAPLTQLFSKEPSEVQVCEIQTRLIGRFFNNCPNGSIVDEVDVRVSGQPPYNYFTTVMVSCVKQTVICTNKKD
jgi:hypothetical protein